MDFGGIRKSESRGIVDLIAIRKDHRQDGPGLKRGDLLEIVLIQTKGGSAPRPTCDDLARLKRVARYHKASAIVLAEWRRGEYLELFKLNGSRWRSVSPDQVFGGANRMAASNRLQRTVMDKVRRAQAATRHR